MKLCFCNSAFGICICDVPFQQPIPGDNVTVKSRNSALGYIMSSQSPSTQLWGYAFLKFRFGNSAIGNTYLPDFASAIRPMVICLVADLFLFCYERDFMMSLSDDKQADVIDAFQQPIPGDNVTAKSRNSALGYIMSSQSPSTQLWGYAFLKFRFGNSAIGKTYLPDFASAIRPMVICLVADLFLFCYERDFMMSLSDDKQADVIDAFNTTSRYLDDILNINNVYFENMVSQIYPSELQLNKANASDTEAHF